MTSSTLAGGSIRILWDEDDSAEVTITGNNASFTVGGAPVTFPYTLTSSTTFTTTQSGTYTVSVQHYGYEIAGTPDGTRQVSLRFGEEEIFAPTPDSRGAGDGFASMVRDIIADDVPSSGTAVGAALAATFVGRWQPSRVYSVGDIASTADGALIERVTAGTSAATYAADAANWRTASGLVEDISSRMGLSIRDYPRLSGETDDLPRFQRAVTALETAGGGRLLVPWTAGGYEFAFTPGSTILDPTRILITTDNIEIWGFGKPTINMTGLTTAYLFSIDDYASSGRDIFTAFSFAGVDSGHVSGLRFAGEFTGDDIFRYQSPRAIGVAFKGATNSSARDIDGENIHGNVINVVNSYVTYDAPFANSENVTLDNIHAVHCLENGVNYMGGTYNCVASRITATECANGLESACNGFVLNGAVLTGNRSSNLALSGTDMTLNGVICTGAVRYEAGVPNPGYGFGVVITGGSGFQFNGGKFNDNYSHGIYLYPGVTDVQFTSPEVKGNAVNATNKVAIQMVGTAGSRIQRVTFLGGELECTGAVTGGIPNYADDVRIEGMRGTFETAASSFTFAGDCNGSITTGNRFNKPVTMNDLTGESYDNGTYRRFDRSSVPTTGSWLLGDMVFATTPGQGAISQWRCIQGGTLGTLNGGATTGSITTGTATLTVSSATGLYRGAWITIAGVIGVKKVLSVSGTTVTLDANADATVSGAAVAYRAAVFIAAAQNGPKTSIAAAPDFVGQHAQVANVHYVANGTSAATDWKRVRTEEVVAKSANYTATTLDRTILATGGAGGITITLPTVVAGARYEVKKVDAGAGAVTVATTSSQTIDGVTTKSLAAQWDKVTVVSDGTAWFIV